VRLTTITLLACIVLATTPSSVLAQQWERMKDGDRLGWEIVVGKNAPDEIGRQLRVQVIPIEIGYKISMHDDFSRKEVVYLIKVEGQYMATSPLWFKMSVGVDRKVVFPPPSAGAPGVLENREQYTWRPLDTPCQFDYLRIVRPHLHQAPEELREVLRPLLASKITVNAEACEQLRKCETSKPKIKSRRPNRKR